MIIHESFDTRPNLLNIEISDNWPEETKENMRTAQKNVRDAFFLEYGQADNEQKIKNFLDIGAELTSVISYHNTFFRECKSAFIIGSYYPALTGACALGERILNHLVLNLRDYYKNTTNYKKVHNKSSFDNWDLAIDTLVDWGILLEGVPQLFKDLLEVRNASIHFGSHLETDSRTPALQALNLVHNIMIEQFGSRPGGKRNWFINGAPGFPFIKKEFEEIPFIKEFYIPSAILLGPYHRIASDDNNLRIYDHENYEDREISDDEFVNLLNDFRVNNVCE
jgi:hypothetical protein